MRDASALLRRFPRSDEIWQIGRFRLPIWIEEEDRAPFRPSMAICARLPSGLVFTSEPREGDLEPLAVWETLAGAIEAWSLVPALVQVVEDDVADDLRERLSDCGLRVELRDELPLLDGTVAALAQGLGDPTPGPLSGAGVTVEQMASFRQPHGKPGSGLDRGCQ